MIIIRYLDNNESLSIVINVWFQGEVHADATWETQEAAAGEGQETAAGAGQGGQGQGAAQVSTQWEVSQGGLFDNLLFIIHNKLEYKSKKF